jgi:hypothetical protein
MVTTYAAVAARVLRRWQVLPALATVELRLASTPVKLPVRIPALIYTATTSVPGRRPEPVYRRAAVVHALLVRLVGGGNLEQALAVWLPLESSLLLRRLMLGLFRLLLLVLQGLQLPVLRLIVSEAILLADSLPLCQLQLVQAML